MKLFRTLSVIAMLLGAIPVANANLVASSIEDFSGAQGASGWRYGFFNQGTDASALQSYTADSFREFDLFADNEWMASASLEGVGPDNNAFLGVGANGAHPTGIGPGEQDAVIWAIRRYQSGLDGRLEVQFDLRKSNLDNPRGGGITGRIFVDGVERLSQQIANADGLGVQDIVMLDVMVGSVIDFVVDPLGALPVDQSSNDGLYSARADRTVFSAVIRNAALVPEPTTAALLMLGVVGGLASTRRRGGSR